MQTLKENVLQRIPIDNPEHAQHHHSLFTQKAEPSAWCRWLVIVYSVGISLPRRLYMVFLTARMIFS